MRSATFPILLLVLILPASPGEQPRPAGEQEWKAHMARGVEMLRQQQFEAAKTQFLRATTLQDKRPEGFFYLGLASINLRQAAEAERAFRQAVALNVRSARTHFYLGLSYGQQNKTREAIREMQEAIEIDSQHKDALYNLGLLLLESGQPAEAAQYLERAERSGMETPELAVNLIRANLTAGKTDQALAVAASASVQYEASAAFQSAAGKVFLEAGLPRPARTYLLASPRFCCR